MAERPAFDPSRIRAPRSGDEAPGPITPSRLNELIRAAINRNVPSTLHVLGEIGNLTRPASGHLYFSLKDAQSEIRCVMWRSAAVKLKFEPEGGMEVIATGGLDVYAARGTVQLIVRKIEPRGVGALELAFRQLKERLARQGLFDLERKRPLPRVPRRIAVVTSPSGAAIRDVLQTLGRRFPALEILVFPVRVQGDGAAEEIAGAIALANRHAAALGGIDVLIVGRGGGSLEDLWAFNEEVVVRAIAASAIPVVSAVGHEVDVSLSDLVADVRAATPTAAAELVAPVLDDLLDALATQTLRLTRSVRQGIALARQTFAATIAFDGLARPLTRIRERGQRLDEWQARLRLLAVERFRVERERLLRAELAIMRFGTRQPLLRREHALESRVLRLRHAGERLFAEQARRCERVLHRLSAVSPMHPVRLYGQRLHDRAERLSTSIARTLRHRRQLLAARLEAVTACNPKGVLARGYSITRDAKTRRLIRSVADIRDKLRTITELADGEFHSTADDPRQPNLFD